MPPPLHANVAPEVVDDAVSVTDELVQVISAGGAIDTFGVTVFCETVADAVALHPAAVAVTVYVPEVETDLVAPVPPPLHAYVTPGVADVAVSVTLVLLQVSVAGGFIFTSGGVPLGVKV